MAVPVRLHLRLGRRAGHHGVGPGLLSPDPLTRVAPFARAALLCRCPRCGDGRLFAGLLTVRDACAVCGLDLRAEDSGDGAAVGVILLLGTVVVGFAFWVDAAFRPPLWVHAVLWPVVTLPLAVLLMRPAKAALVWSQFRNRSLDGAP